MKKSIAKTAIDVFKSTKAEKLYVSKDGEFFTSSNLAANADKEYKTITRLECEMVVNGPESKAANTAAEAQALLEAEAEEKAIERGKELKTALDASNDKISYLEQLKREDLDALGTQLEADVAGAQNKEAAKALIRKELQLDPVVKDESKKEVKEVKGVLEVAKGVGEGTEGTDKNAE